MNHTDRRSISVLSRRALALIFVFVSLSAQSYEPEEADLKAGGTWSPSDATTGAAAAPTAASSAKPISNAGTASMPSAITAAQACEKAKNLASSACLESLSPELQTGISAINALMSGADMMGMTKVCSKYKKAMDLANTAMTAFSAACGYLKYSCDTACQASAKSLTSASTALSGALTAATAMKPADPDAELIPKDQATVTKMQTENTASQAVCTGYKIQLAAAALGGAALLKKFSTAQKCEEETSTLNCAATPTDPKCVAAAVDCTKAENNTKIECICLKNPRNAGCGGDNTASGNSVMAASQGSSRGATATALPDPNLSVNQDLSPRLNPGDIAGSGAGGGGASGGAAPGGASGGGGKGADNAKSGVTTRAGLNPNILTGDSGGGGGGWRGGGGSGSSDSDNYKAYLPGGAKDPTRALASPGAGMSDVTGSGGADNWTKVTNRYRDNKPTLMGE